jgi:hypothetical protein
MSSPLDSSFIPHELPLIRGSIEKVEEETEQKKFEAEMEKQKIRKIDPDQRKERRRKQEQSEGNEKIIQDAQELIENQGDSLYAIQTPDIKHLLKKKKKTDDVEVVPFLPPSPMQSASNLFEEKSFSLNLAEPPASWIAEQKNRPSFSSSTDNALSTDPIVLPNEEISSVYEAKEVIASKEPIAPALETITSTEEEKTSLSLVSPRPEMKKKSEEKEIFTAHPTFEFTPFAFSSPPDLKAAPSRLHRLHPEFFAILERMLGVITLLQTCKGSSKTTFCLNQPHFASSIFFGCQITIEECELAPKEFNIRLAGNAKAVEAFAAQKQALEKVFEEGVTEGRFHFKVHRIETELLL